MGYKTENWQDIEEGDIVEVVNCFYHTIPFTGHKEVTRVYWTNEDGKSIGLKDDNGGGDGIGKKGGDWSLIVGDNAPNQVRLIRKKGEEVVSTDTLKIGDEVTHEAGDVYTLTDFEGCSRIFPDDCRGIQVMTCAAGLFPRSEITHINGIPVGSSVKKPTEESFIPEGYRVERTSYTDEDGYDITGYIVSTPRQNGVRSNTSVWKSDHDPAHKLLWEILEKHYK